MKSLFGSDSKIVRHLVATGAFRRFLEGLEILSCSLGAALGKTNTALMYPMPQLGQTKIPPTVEDATVCTALTISDFEEPALFPFLFTKRESIGCFSEGL